MPSIFTHEFDTPVYKGKVSINTGLFINGQFVDGSDKTTIEYVLLIDTLGVTANGSYRTIVWSTQVCLTLSLTQNRLRMLTIRWSWAPYSQW